MKTTTGAHRPRRITATAVLVSLLLGVLAGVLGVVGPAMADEDEEGNDYSLYALAGKATLYFSAVSSPEGGGSGGEDDESGEESVVPEEWRPITSSAANGGSMLGYADPKFSLGDPTSWLLAQMSASSQSTTYAALATISEGEGGKPANRGVLDYSYFGAANADLGLASMTGGKMSGGPLASAIRVPMGLMLWLVYVGAVAVNSLFGIFLSVLQAINPFRWFHDSVSKSSQVWADGMTQGATSDGTLRGLSKFISDWYEPLTKLSWSVMVPLFLATMVLGMLFFKKMDKGSALRKFLIRLFFIGVGVPLLGSMYTSALNAMAAETDNPSGPTEVVASTLVDFEGWMVKDRLAVPAEGLIGFHPSKGEAYVSAKLHVRNTAMAINKQTYRGTGAFAELEPYQPNTTDHDVSRVLENSTNTLSSGEVGGGTESVRAAMGLIWRYANATTLEASALESSFKASISASPVPSSTTRGWFVEDPYDEVDGFGIGSGGVAPESNPMFAVKPGTGLVTNNVDADHTGSRRFTTTGVTQVCGTKVSDDDGQPLACNLSPLAAYNYLNTEFQPTSMTTYSSEKSSSGLVRGSYYTVSLVGTGIERGVYLLNAMVLLTSLTLLGVWYAVGMVVGSVKRMFTMVASIPFATLGALGAIAKVVTSVVAMIMEVFATFFLYSLVSKFLLAIPVATSLPLSAGMELGALGGFLGNPVLAMILVVTMTLIGNLLVIALTFGMLKVRKTVMKAIDEAVTKIVDKFTGESSGGQGGSGAQGGAGRALRQAAPMAASLARSRGKGGSAAGSTTPTNAGGTNGSAPAGNGSGAADGQGASKGASKGSSSGAGVTGASDDRASAGGAWGAVSDSDRENVDRTTAKRVMDQGGLSQVGAAGASRSRAGASSDANAGSSGSAAAGGGASASLAAHSAGDGASAGQRPTNRKAGQQAATSLSGHGVDAGKGVTQSQPQGGSRVAAAPPVKVQPSKAQPAPAQPAPAQSGRAATPPAPVPPRAEPKPKPPVPPMPPKMPRLGPEGNRDS